MCVCVCVLSVCVINQYSTCEVRETSSLLISCAVADSSCDGPGSSRCPSLLLAGGRFSRSFCCSCNSVNKFEVC